MRDRLLAISRTTLAIALLLAAATASSAEPPGSTTRALSAPVSAPQPTEPKTAVRAEEPARYETRLIIHQRIQSVDPAEWMSRWGAVERQARR